MFKQKFVCQSTQKDWLPKNFRQGSQVFKSVRSLQLCIGPVLWLCIFCKVPERASAYMLLYLVKAAQFAFACACLMFLIAVRAADRAQLQLNDGCTCLSWTS